MALQMCRLCQAFAKASTNPASFSSFDDYLASPTTAKKKDEGVLCIHILRDNKEARVCKQKKAG